MATEIFNEKSMTALQTPVAPAPAIELVTITPKAAEKAKALLAEGHAFEMSIEEQAAALMADGLAMSSREPSLNVVSTFAAFYEGIAREGLDMWRYQRHLPGVNAGPHVVVPLSPRGSRPRPRRSRRFAAPPP